MIFPASILKLPAASGPFWIPRQTVSLLYLRHCRYKDCGQGLSSGPLITKYTATTGIYMFNNAFIPTKLIYCVCRCQNLCFWTLYVLKIEFSAKSPLVDAWGGPQPIGAQLSPLLIGPLGGTDWAAASEPRQKAFRRRRGRSMDPWREEGDPYSTVKHLHTKSKCKYLLLQHLFQQSCRGSRRKKWILRGFRCLKIFDAEGTPLRRHCHFGVLKCFYVYFVSISSWLLGLYDGDW